MGAYPGRPPNDGNFKPGTSGNPGGRPKEARAIAAEARKYAFEMLEGLVEIARDKDASQATRLQAMIHILDRALGKPSTPIDLEVRKQLEDMSVEELERLEQKLVGLTLLPGLPQEEAAE